jgi:hypothetical protein
VTFGAYNLIIVPLLITNILVEEHEGPSTIPVSTSATGNNSEPVPSTTHPHNLTSV